MSLRLTNLELPVEEPEEQLRDLIAARLGLRAGEPITWRILRKSLDARSRDSLRFVYTIVVAWPGEAEWRRANSGSANVERFDPAQCEEPLLGKLPLGEGGAGTFSDGKLTCRMSGPDVDWWAPVGSETGRKAHAMQLSHRASYQGRQWTYKYFPECDGRLAADRGQLNSLRGRMSRVPIRRSSPPVEGELAMKSHAPLIIWFASFAALLLGIPWQHVAEAQIIRATQESDGAIRVIAPGAFETTFTKRKGFGHIWFDLKHDPKKGRDLAPVDDENGFLWIKTAPGESTDGSWYANPVQELELLEAGPVRVRVRLKGWHARYGKTTPDALWKELAFEQVFTLYSTGSIYVDYSLLTETTVPLKHFLLITKSNGEMGTQWNGRGCERSSQRRRARAGVAEPLRDCEQLVFVHAAVVQWSHLFPGHFGSHVSGQVWWLLLA